MDAFYLKSSLLTRIHSRLTESGPEILPLPEEKRRFVASLLKKNTDISYRDVLMLVELISDHHVNPDIGIEFGLGLDFAAMRAGGIYARSADDFRVGIQSMIRAMRVTAYGLVRELHQEGKSAWLESHFLPSRLSEMRIARQAAAAAMFRSCQLILGERWKPQRIYFDFPPPEQLSKYRHWFQCDLIFNAECCSIQFDASLLDLPLPGRDIVLHEVMAEHMALLEQEEQKNIVSVIYQLIDSQMRGGHCSLDNIARYFPFEKRVLQRKLRQHGRSYKDIHDEVLLQRAREYLSAGLSVLETSQLLGFSSANAFTNAFKKKTGVSPSQWKSNAHESK